MIPIDFLDEGKTPSLSMAQSQKGEHFPLIGLQKTPSSTPPRVGFGNDLPW